MPSNTNARRVALLAAGTAAVAAAACKDPTSVPDLNSLPATVVEGNLNATSTQLLVTGLVNREREILVNNGGRFLVFAQTLGRDVYIIDPSENRFQTELLAGQIDPAGFTGGGGGFTEAFNAVRAADLLINKVGTAGDLTAAQQSGVKGIAYTFKALAIYHAWELRGASGVPLGNAEATVTGPELVTANPIRCTPAVLARVSDLLDSGATALAGAGTAFAVTLPGGFNTNGDFRTVANFLKFNRGLKGKAEFYRGLVGNGGQAAYQSALTALNASFLDTTAATTAGVYYTFAAAPDVFNPLAAATVYLNPTLTAAPANAGAFGQSQVLAAGDLRGSKITTGSSVTRNGVTTTLRSPLTAANATNLTRPLPLLRNAELILLRAQVENELGQYAAATADMNVVRVKEGGLAPYAVSTDRATNVQRVLYEKRFSLLLEGAQRLVDLRSYNLLNATNLGSSQRADDAFNGSLPIPQSELDQRRQTAAQAACVQ